MKIRTTRSTRTVIALLAFALVLIFSHALAQSQRGEFVARRFRDSGGVLPYRIFIPPSYDKRQKYPLVLWLHGSGGRGSDNVRQISAGNLRGTHVWTTPANQSRYPCFVLAPQCPENEVWTSGDKPLTPGPRLRQAVRLLASIEQEFSIDTDRLYVAGQSMGGFGTWSLISAHPNMFAAAIPINGGGDTSKASLLRDLPLWVFHGEKDEAVDVEQSRRMVAAIRRAGGSPKYTEYRGAGHLIWARVFSEPDLVPWLFSQSRTKR